MPYDAIIFDFDGVLITGRRTPGGVYKAATRATLAAYGHENPQGWDHRLERPSDASTFRETCESWDLPAEEAWAYREAAATHIEDAWLDRGDRAPSKDTHVLPDLAEAYAIGIASNNRNALVGRCLDYFDWHEQIDAYRGRYPTLEEYEHRKPHPRFLRAVIQHLAAEEPLYVGDRESDVIAASRVDCDSVLLRRTDQDRPVEQTPTYNVASLTELLQHLDHV